MVEEKRTREDSAKCLSLSRPVNCGDHKDQSMTEQRAAECGRSDPAMHSAFGDLTASLILTSMSNALLVKSLSMVSFMAWMVIVEIYLPAGCSSTTVLPWESVIPFQVDALRG